MSMEESDNSKERIYVRQYPINEKLLDSHGYAVSVLNMEVMNLVYSGKTPLAQNYKQVYEASGMKVFENTDVLPRAFVVHTAEVIEDDKLIVLILEVVRRDSAYIDI